MATDLQQTLQRITRKAESLADRYEALREAKREADRRIAGLEAELARARSEVRELQSRVEYLTVVGLVNPDRQQVARSRAIIAGLVQEIDKCIADLSE